MLSDEEREQLSLAESILSSEAFMWLMAGSNHQEAQLASLKPAYRLWAEKSGGYKKYNRLNEKIINTTNQNGTETK